MNPRAKYYDLQLLSLQSIFEYLLYYFLSLHSSQKWIGKSNWTGTTWQFDILKNKPSN
jgi:hypothetical protein